MWRQALYSWSAFPGITAARFVSLLASGETPETILKSYPYLEAEDIQEALAYAAFLADEQVIEFA
jgi:uncharacterized protein (DUF433 family)